VEHTSADGHVAGPTTLTRRDPACSVLTRAARRKARRTTTAIGSRADRRVPWLRSFLTQGLTVFVFHEITDVPSEFQQKTASYTSPGLFQRQITWIRDRFRVIEPTALAQLGGSGQLSERAALITFDDSWAGIFRVGLPILASLDVPSLCFLNMATVEGMPDLSAVRFYEQTRPTEGGPTLEGRLDAIRAPQILSQIRDRYLADRTFASFQGPTATHQDLAEAVSLGRAVWFGSHLFHHWDLLDVTVDLFAESVEANGRALSAYRNALPVLATPYGRKAAYLSDLSSRLGIRLVFVGTGTQNHRLTPFILDRVTLDTESSSPGEWWYTTHRRRLFGSLGVSPRPEAAVD
jgi:peptidoglycan/xylan/chitin deacetylase (PgdA/CDA1 family)